MTRKATHPERNAHRISALAALIEEHMQAYMSAATTVDEFYGCLDNWCDAQGDEEEKGYIRDRIERLAIDMWAHLIASGGVRHLYEVTATDNHLDAFDMVRAALFHLAETSEEELYE